MTGACLCAHHSSTHAKRSHSFPDENHAWAQCCLALSPGGRGQDGSPVITFPDYPAFSDVPDKEFQNVMTYLTSIPRCVSLSDEEVLPRGPRVPPRSHSPHGAAGARVPLDPFPAPSVPRLLHWQGYTEQEGHTTGRPQGRGGRETLRGPAH